MPKMTPNGSQIIHLILHCPIWSLFAHDTDLESTGIVTQTSSDPSSVVTKQAICAATHQSLMNVKLNLQMIWPYHEDKLILQIPKQLYTHHPGLS